MNSEKNNPLIDEVTPDLEGFIDCGEDPDCEKKYYTLVGREIPDSGDAK